MQHFAAWDNYVGDALATFIYLQQQPEIDAARSGLIGHSEGAYLVEQIASQQVAHPPAALVLISAPGRPYDVLTREQLDHALQRDHTSADTTAFVLGKYDTIVAGIKATGHTPLDALVAVEVNPQVPTDIKQLMASLFTPYNDLFCQGAVSGGMRSCCPVLLRCISFSLERLKPFCKLVFELASACFLISLQQFQLDRDAINLRLQAVMEFLIGRVSLHLKSFQPGLDLCPGLTSCDH